MASPLQAAPRSRRRLACALGLAAAAAFPALAAASPAAAPPHLVLSAHALSLAVPGGAEPASALGVRLRNTGGDLVLPAVRDGAHVRIAQRVGGRSRPLTAVTATRRRPYLLRDGLPDAVTLELSNRSGVVARMRSAWCPQLGARRSTPKSCGDPLSRDVTWVVAHGQTVDLLMRGELEGLRGRLRGGSYRAVVRFDARRRLRRSGGPVEWRGSVSVIRSGRGRPGGVSDPPREHGTPPTFEDQPADTAHLAGARLPDLIPLPAQALSVVHDAEHGDTLRFAGDVADVGAALTVDASLQPGDPPGSMSAVQVVAGPDGPLRHPAGHLVFDNDDGHNHWHFFDLAHYRLTRAGSGETVQLSTKIGFCFGDTDPFDQSVPGAPVAPIRPPLPEASCEHKNPGATSVHMTLDAGWLDRYDQTVAGQAFDVTKLPNGRYAIAIEVNPRGILAEASAANNRSVRTFTLGGRPGRRTLTVPPVDGVDTERPF